MKLNLNFRLKIALSCLFEDGDKEVNRLFLRIESMISTSRDKLAFLGGILRDKMTIFNDRDIHEN